MNEKVLKQALDALEIAKKFVQHNHGNDSVAVPIENAIAAIASEQAKGLEPWAHAYRYKQEVAAAKSEWPDEDPYWLWQFEIGEPRVVDGIEVEQISLYTTPPAQPARELVGLVDVMDTGMQSLQLVFKSRTVADAAKVAIESKLREKNAGQPVVKEN